MSRIGTIKIRHGKGLLEGRPELERFWWDIRDNGGSYVTAFFVRTGENEDFVEFKRSPSPPPRSIMSMVLT